MTDQQDNGQDRSNFDWDSALPFIRRIDALNREIKKIMDAAKEECAVLRDDIKTVKTEAHDAGFRRQPFNAVLADIKDLRKIDARRDKLGEEQQDDYDQLRMALGMLTDYQLELFK